MMETVMERFEAKIDKSTGCWEWKASKDKDGYGRFRFSGRSQKASRVAWMLYVGEIPSGMLVCHHCDNPGCVNPAHLFLGTDAANTRDKYDKGRGVTGEKNGRAKLTVEQVIEIRSKYATGEHQRSLAAQYGVAYQHISLIVRRVNWTHL